MMNGLSGKVVIISGGAQGIGFAAAELLIDSGSNVMIADINEAVGEKAVAQLNERTAPNKGKAQFVRVDVTDEASVKAMVDKTVSTFGKLDGAINQAVFTPRGTIVHQMEASQWDQSHSVNLRGQFLCMKHQIAAMLENGGGSIVAISSTAAVQAVPGSSDYCAMKSGVNGLVRAAARDYVSKGIRVNGIMPGATDTPGFRQSAVDNPDFANINDALPMKRPAKPVEVGAGAVWLLSDYASYTTGIIMPIDGGLTY